MLIDALLRLLLGDKKTVVSDKRNRAKFEEFNDEVVNGKYAISTRSTMRVDCYHKHRCGMRLVELREQQSCSAVNCNNYADYLVRSDTRVYRYCQYHAAQFAAKHELDLPPKPGYCNGLPGGSLYASEDIVVVVSPDAKTRTNPRRRNY